MYIRAYFIFCIQRAYAYSLYADPDPVLDPDTDSEVQNATFFQKIYQILFDFFELILIADKEVFSSWEKKS